MDLMEVTRRMYTVKRALWLWVACAACTLIDVRCLRISFILRHARESTSGEIGKILRVRTVDSRSFIYLLSYLSLHAIVLQIYWSRVVASRTPPMPMHDSFSCVGERTEEMHAYHANNVVRSRWNAPENENGFPPVATVEKSSVCAIAAVLHFPESAVMKPAGSPRYFLIYTLLINLN